MNRTSRILEIVAIVLVVWILVGEKPDERNERSSERVPLPARYCGEPPTRNYTQLGVNRFITWSEDGKEIFIWQLQGQGPVCVARGHADGLLGSLHTIDTDVQTWISDLPTPGFGSTGFQR